MTLPPNKGFLHASMALLNTFIAITHTRLRVLALDMEEDRLYAVNIAKWMLLAAFFLAIGVLLLTALMLMLFWDHHRIIVISVLIVAFLLAGVLSWRCAIVKIRQKPVLFGGSLAELVKDWQATQPQGKEG